MNQGSNDETMRRYWDLVFSITIAIINIIYLMFFLLLMRIILESLAILSVLLSYPTSLKVPFKKDTSLNLFTLESVIVS